MQDRKVKCSAFLAMSLDGYIARSDGSTDWLHGYDIDGEDYGYGEYISSIDAIIMGRKTFEQVLTFKEWPYDLPIYILSKTLQEGNLPNSCYLWKKTPELLLSELQSRSMRHLYIDGGQTILYFLKFALLDEIIVTVVPVLLSKGIPLFSGNYPGIVLECQESKSYLSGLVRIKYKIAT